MSTNTETPPITVTVEKLAEAFELWNNGFRATSSRRLTYEECDAIKVSEQSGQCGAGFYQLLVHVGAR